MEVVEDWMPQEDDLNSLVEVLRDSIIPDSGTQQKVQEKLFVMQKHPHFLNYLLYILRNSLAYEEHIRALSVIILKNNVLTMFDSLTSSVLNLIRQQCLHLITDSSKEVRASVTTLIGILVWKGSVTSWPNVIPHLCNLLESQDSQLSETALMALFKICEEFLSKKGTENEEFNDSIYVLVSKFITLVTNEHIFIRKDSIKLLNQAMQDSSLAMKTHFNSKLYFNNLLKIIKDDDADVQKLICQAFVIFIELQDPAILPCMPIVMEYVLHMTQHGNTVVALQACEFWLSMARITACKDILSPYIERLLPILLKNMKYSAYELDALKNHLGIDEHLEDKIEDIYPFHVRSVQTNVEDDDYDLCNGDEENYEQTDAVGEPYVGWTLRKCSAASLDTLAVQFGDDILPIFLPLMNETLNSTDLLTKESGILALGAIGDGCLNGLRLYLPNLIKYLLLCMNNDNSLIRVITCWTISRYTVWLMEEQHSAETYFIPVMTTILRHFLDGNKRVQRAALSAFCIFQEEARLKLVPYIDFILQAYLSCFKKYKFRSYLLLYDAISVLAQSVGNNLNRQNYIELLIPPLLEKFNSSTDYCEEPFLALMECLSNVSAALEVGFLPYTEIIYSRCLLIINETVNGVQCYMENPNEYELPDREPLCVAYDVLLGMIVGLKTYFVKFVTNSNLLQSMYFTLQDELVQVRQIALALYGELTKLCFSHINFTVPQLMPIIIENLDKRYDVACNNAAWTIGKLCLAMGDQIEPYSNQIFEKYLEIMQTVNGTKTMYQTVAVALCTLGLICPNKIAPHLSNIIRPCCQAMRNIGDCEEKEIGFRGLCTLIKMNPLAVINDVIYIYDAVASFNEVKSDFKEMVVKILETFQSIIGENNMLQIYDQFPPVLKRRLHNLYGI